MTISIIYWSGTGNTESMAKYIREGAESVGANVSIKDVSKATVTDVTGCDIAVLGCPSMGDEVLEDPEFEPFIESILDKVSGKKLALFGSYGWGDGLWMRNWAEQMQRAGAELVCEPLTVNEAPAGAGVEKCTDFGKKLVSP